MYKIETFIPEFALDSLRNALLEVDAGHIGNYKGCLTISKVTGVWYSDEGSNPTVGAVGEWSQEPELKVEFNVDSMVKKDLTIQKILEVHPYETPVINVIKLVV